MMLFPGRGPGRFRVRPRLVHLLCLGGSTLLLDARLALATQDIQFNSGFMRQGQAHAADAGLQALTALGRGQNLVPGKYWVQISVNRQYFGEHELSFEQHTDSARLLPCLSPALLEQMGLRLQSLTEPLSETTACLPLLQVIPEARLDFDARTLALAISIPQVHMRRDSARQVDPAQWDNGINAAFINYQASAMQSTHRRGGNRSSDDLYLNSGINLGAWRLRSNHSLQHDEHGERTWKRAYTYVQRDLPGSRAAMTLGETFTGGDVFRSLPIKGVQVRSDREMLDDNLQGYAPVIRGVALSRAKLEVLQNGYPIYSTYVSAGPYEIDDLTTVGSGELEIVLTEEDGQVRRFSQPYSTISNLLREGVWQYSAALGRYNGATETTEPLFWQATGAWGLGWNSTLYGGVLASDFYRATSLGLARDMGNVGALALDVTRSEATLGSGRDAATQGLSYALKYGKAFTSHTTLRFAGYRYSTEGYRDFDEAVQQRDHSTRFQGSRRSRLEASVHQRLGSNSSLNLTLSNQDYWRSDYRQRQYQLNFSTRRDKVTYNFYASQSLSDKRGTERQFGLSISMPLDWGHSSNATFDLFNNGERYSQRASLGGSLDENRLSYRVGVSNELNRTQAASLSMGYQGPHASFGAGLTQGSEHRSLSLNANGAVLLHADGLALGASLGETNALVQVPGIGGAGVENAIGTRTDARGYALVSYLRPYRVNPLVLETGALGPEVEIDNGITHVVPSRGAVVKARFDARKVTRLVLTVRRPDGVALPFGAQVSDSKGQALGMVSQAGQLMLATGQEPQVLEVRWGTDTQPQCRLSIDPASMAQREGYRLQEVTCR
ncbi:fimbria/pilus outer membrane usher protein [Pseudomonas syringae]